MFQHIMNHRAAKFMKSFKMLIDPREITALRRQCASLGSANGCTRYSSTVVTAIKTLVPAQEGTMWKEGAIETKMTMHDAIQKSVIIRNLKPLCNMNYMSGNLDEFSRIVQQYLEDHILEKTNDEIAVWIATKAAQMEEFYAI